MPASTHQSPQHLNIQHLNILRIEPCHSPVIPAQRTFKVATLGQQLRHERTRPLGQRRVASQPLQLGVRLVNPAVFEVALASVNRAEQPSSPPSRISRASNSLARSLRPALRHASAASSRISPRSSGYSSASASRPAASSTVVTTTETVPVTRLRTTPPHAIRKPVRTMLKQESQRRWPAPSWAGGITMRTSLTSWPVTRFHSVCAGRTRRAVADEVAEAGRTAGAVRRCGEDQPLPTPTRSP